MEYCEICYKIDEVYSCDTCDRKYCYECSYIYSLHYQFQGCRCYECSEQPRIKKLTKQEIRKNKIKILVDI